MQCPTCEGKGYTEHQFGLIQLRCKVCKGTKEVPDPETKVGYFFCMECQRYHKPNSQLGKKHLGSKFKAPELYILPCVDGDNRPLKERVEEAHKISESAEKEALNDSNSGTGQDNTTTGSPDTG